MKKKQRPQNEVMKRLQPPSSLGGLCSLKALTARSVLSWQSASQTTSKVIKVIKPPR